MGVLQFFNTIKSFSYTKDCIQVISTPISIKYFFIDFNSMIHNSKNFILKDKIFFGLGASISSVLFFFTIGYASKYLSNYLKTERVWKIINIFIIIFMSFLALYVLSNILNWFIFSPHKN